MSAESLFSIAAIFISVASLVFTLVLNRRMSHSNAVGSCFSLMAQAESMLKDVPTGLKFHTISSQDLSEIGLSAEEFTYLLVNFTSAGVYYRMFMPNNNDPFEEGSYRYTMLLSPETRKAWPLLKKMINPEIGSYGKKIEATIRIIESKGQF